MVIELVLDLDCLWARWKVLNSVFDSVRLMVQLRDERWAQRLVQRSVALTENKME